jgi:hypothetical protein
MKRGKIPKILRGYFKAKINDLKEGFFSKEAFFHPSNGFLISAFYPVSCIYPQHSLIWLVSGLTTALLRGAF